MENNSEVEIENDSQFQETETSYTDHYVELPELDETQIWDGEDVKREVVLYLSTKDGKVNGPETPPFQLPYRWTFETLRKCILSYVSTRTDVPQELINVLNIYYKKSGRSRSVVALKSDSDIPALLKEYPLTYASGKKKTGWGKTVLYLAVDWTSTVDENITGSPSLRRSPRAASKSHAIDIFLFTADKKNSDVKITGSASVIPKIPVSYSLDEIKRKIREVENESVIYVPVKGLFWLRKGKKQCVNLNSEEDLEACKKEYKDGKGNIASIRLACATVPLGATPLPNTNKRKRQLWYSAENSSSLAGESGDSRDVNLIEAAKTLEAESSKKVTSESNELWNDVHCNLVRELERLGTLQRYGHKHLKLWTDLITEGKSGGVGEEPAWEKYIEVIGVPPKRKCTKRDYDEKTDKIDNDQLMKNILLQNSCMMAAMMSANMSYMQQGRPNFQQPQQPQTCFPSFSSGSSSFPTSPTFPSNGLGANCEEMSAKKLKDYNLNDCCDFLCSLKLDKYVMNFRESQMDGLLLSSLIHPHFGNMLLTEMGIGDQHDANMIIEAVKRHM